MLFNQPFPFVFLDHQFTVLLCVHTLRIPEAQPCFCAFIVAVRFDEVNFVV